MPAGLSSFSGMLPGYLIHRLRSHTRLPSCHCSLIPLLPCVLQDTWRYMRPTMPLMLQWPLDMHVFKAYMLQRSGQGRQVLCVT
jgi:hypothetical protein